MALILVIDDDTMVRRTVRALLENAGHAVVDAVDGKTGIMLLEASDVDLVITDIYMPGDDGITTIRRIRRDFPAIPVITISGGSNAGNMNEVALALGARYALNKPFTNAELLDAVRVVRL
jgi:CheY-like chemotaxis protein